MAEFSVIGKPFPRIDAKAKAMGDAKYTADMRLPGMLYGKVLRSPFPHARIRQIETARAKGLTGVRAVITAADTPKIKYGLVVDDELPLCDDRVRYVGDEVAAVAAIDRDTAEEALDLIEVEYEELPAVFDPEEALRPGAPVLHEQFPNNVASHLNFERGDIEAGLREAAVVLEETFRTQCHHQYYMENVAALANWSEGKLTIWCPLQFLEIPRQLLAKALNLRLSDIRMIQAYVGGGFGGKLDQKLPVVTALLALKSRRPVLCEHTREEEMQAARPRVPMIIRLKMGARKDGVITAKDTQIIADNGAYSNWAQGILSTAATRVDSAYRYRNIRTDAKLVYTNKTPTGAFRGFGNPQITFAVGSMIDMLARELGIDPAEMHRKNATQTGDVTAHGWVINSCGLTECIDRALERIGWPAKRQQKTFGRGLGVACAIHVSGNRIIGDYDGSAAFVKLNEDGRANVICGEGEIGQGANTIFAQIAAEELGVRYEDVDMSVADTDVTPFALGAWATRVTAIGGNGVRMAARDAKRQLLEAAAEKLEANPDDLVIREGVISVKGLPGRSLTVADAVKASMYKKGGTPVIGRGQFSVDTTVQVGKEKFGNIAPAYSFACQVAEVEVNPETGVVKVLRVVAADDLGRALNPLSAEGQVEGGVVQGLGYALCEELVFEDGRVLEPMEYEVPTAWLAPNVESILVESIDPFGPYGAKGTGETPLVPVAAVIANAVCDAVGVRITSLPITPEKIRKALKAKQEAAGR
ncbi:MAG: molybdopterin-dependent oxidoreductase [Deltaproteobacteria bacterium]|nr:molybdopterin-dependent oxidoreductase [Deltaproteobacteria bacterium]